MKDNSWSDLNIHVYGGHIHVWGEAAAEQLCNRAIGTFIGEVKFGFSYPIRKECPIVHNGRVIVAMNVVNAKKCHLFLHVVLFDTLKAQIIKF